MKTIIIALLMMFNANANQNYYTTIDGAIYLTPVPDDCPGCAVEFVQVHQQDKWLEFRTDRISRLNFD